jgi:hypothetical protein
MAASRRLDEVPEKAKVPPAGSTLAAPYISAGGSPVNRAAIFTDRGRGCDSEGTVWGKRA